MLLLFTISDDGNAQQQLISKPRPVLRARFELLKYVNKLLEPALPFVDLSRYRQHGSLAHRLCQSKGRIFPAVKEKLWALSLRLSTVQDSTPEVMINMPAESASERVPDETVFSQLCAGFMGSDGRLRPRRSLRCAERGGSDSKSWRVSMRGPGAAAWTDTTDAGGIFRGSTRELCNELQNNAQLELFVASPNSVAGSEGRDKFVPNPLKRDAESLLRYRFVGALLGAAVRSSAFMALDLPALVWKALAGEKHTLRDLEAVDERLGQHLRQLANIAEPKAWAEAAVCWRIRSASRR